jgi:SEC-C motif
MREKNEESSRPLLGEQEVALRFLARESRTSRRLLASSLMEVLDRSVVSGDWYAARVMRALGPSSPYYVFIFTRRHPLDSYEKYLLVRRNLLSIYCRVVKLMYPGAEHIVGIASDASRASLRSEDFMYLDGSKWTTADEAEAREIQVRTGILQKTVHSGHRAHEYPVDQNGVLRKTVYRENSPCLCGSGEPYVRCHGKKQDNTKENRS